MDKIKKIVISFLFACVLPANASAASLYFNPGSGSYEAGKTFSVTVNVSADKAINAVSGVISFPIDKLEVVSLSKSGSIFSLWAKEPSFSNTGGKVNFEGVVLNGFTGASGKVMTISFKTKKAGSGELAFSAGSLLANDGQGSNIISGTEPHKFSIVDNNPPAPEVVAPPAVISKAPSAPTITSSHPDQEKWYNSNDFKPSWEFTPDITSVRTLLNKNPKSIPNVLSDLSVKEKEFKDLDDGTWYFHIQFRNKLGWGEINHFKIQIDTKSPEGFKISFIKGMAGETSQPVVFFSTTDSLSGIDYYKVRIGEEDAIIVQPEEMDDGEYTIPDQSSGNRVLMVQAFDKAGNYFSTAEEFTVNSIESPIITEYPKELSNQDFLNIKGTSNYPQSQINIYFEKDGKEIGVKKTETDMAGNFNFSYEGNLKNGSYRIKAEIVDSNGLRSINNPSVSFTVKNPASDNKFKIEMVTIPLILISLLLVVWFLFRKFLFKKRFK